MKRGHFRKNWKMRFFSLKPESLMYFSNQYTSNEPLGVISLQEAEKISVHKIEDSEQKGKRRNIFKLKTPLKEYFIDTQTEEALNSWMDCINNTLEKTREKTL